MNEASVREIVAEAVERAGGMRPLSREWGISVSMVSDLINGRRAPGPKVLKHLGLVRVKTVAYLPKEPPK